MKRLATLLLLLGVIVGLAGRPALAITPPMAAMSMAKMTQSDMSAMPDCMASMAKAADHQPCKCGLAGCLAMMASGSSMMLATYPVTPAVVAMGKRQDHVAVVAALRGRSTAPEPEPPTTLL